MKHKFKLLMLAIVATFSVKFNSVYGQSTSASNILTGGSSSTPNQYLGSSNNYDIIFKMNASEKMRIQGSNFGIGTASPAYLLDVNGHVNIATSSAYKIGGNNILWHNGHVEDIFVGVNAGASTTGLYNTFMGNLAGNSNTTGVKNTFTGFEAGKLNTADGNVAYGYQALHSNATSVFNTAIGYQALYSSNSCVNCPLGTYATNTACGYQTLFNTQAYGGCAFGFHAGLGNTYGCSLAAFGESAAASNTLGDDNEAFGASSLVYNTTASDNVAIGDHALTTQSYDNGGVIWYSYNVAVGNNALYYNQPTSTTNGYFNTALGFNAGKANTTGKINTFLGADAGMANTTGNYNCFTGFQAGYKNTTGSNNTFNGYAAGYYTTTGQDNTSIGSSSGYSNTTGSYNTYLGYAADGGNFSNSTSIGYGATTIAGDNISIGNASVSYVWCQPGVWNGSDKRIKNTIQANVPGLAFIKLLKPVTYHYDVDQENQILGAGDSIVATHLAQNFPGKYDIQQIQYTGFIAQSVDSAAQKVGYNFSGVHKPADESKEIWGLNYSSFIPPLVQAVQELSKEVDSLKAAAHSGQRISNNQQDSTQNLPVQNVTLASQKAILYQNNPNPAGDQTSIGYFLADGTGKAEMVFFDMYGNEIKRVVLENKGNAKLDVNTRDLDSGIYSYSLIVDGMVIDTLKMARAK